MIGRSCLLLALVLTGPGCLSPGAHVEEEARKTPPVQLKEEAPQPPPVVTADQVTETNAAEMAQTLSRELDQAANERPTAAETSETKP